LQAVRYSGSIRTLFCEHFCTHVQNVITGLLDTTLKHTFCSTRSLVQQAIRLYDFYTELLFLLCKAIRITSLRCGAIGQVDACCVGWRYVT